MLLFYKMHFLVVEDESVFAYICRLFTNNLHTTAAVGSNYIVISVSV